MHVFFTKIIAFIMSAIGFFYQLIDVPYYATGAALDLTGYELVWSDEFEGDSLDRSVWRLHHGEGAVVYGHRESYNAIEIKDGNAIFHIKYYEDGLDGGPAGYYSATLDTSASYTPTYGYFECRAIWPKIYLGSGNFWMQSPNAYNHENGSADGAEIDIFESRDYAGGGYFSSRHKGKKYENVMESNIHYDSGDTAQRLGAKGFLVKGDPYSEFHTYGVKWDSQGYTFYLDGVETFHTSFGLSHAPEYICLSSEIHGSGGVAQENAYAVDGDAKFIVDYVRVYQQTN